MVSLVGWLLELCVEVRRSGVESEGPNDLSEEPFTLSFQLFFFRFPPFVFRAERLAQHQLFYLLDLHVDLDLRRV